MRQQQRILQNKHFIKKTLLDQMEEKRVHAELEKANRITEEQQKIQQNMDEMA